MVSLLELLKLSMHGRRRLFVAVCFIFEQPIPEVIG